MPTIMPTKEATGYPNIRQAGENALLIYLAANASPAVLRQVQWLTLQLRQQLGALLLEVVPSYASVLLVYDFLQLEQNQLQLLLEDLLTQLPSTAVPTLAQSADQQSQLIELPCYYSRETGPDLVMLSQQRGLTEADIIRRHSACRYQVYAIGFAPGFAYLGWVDPALASPRLSSPRLKVPKGAVAIADRQTAVYPAASPGGWNIIGNCPLNLFDLTRQPVMPFTVGAEVQFVPIDRAEFIRLGGEL